jgi:hypothetical protein
MVVSHNKPDRFRSTGISHSFEASIVDMDRGKGPQVMFTTNPFGTAIMPTEDLVALRAWILQHIPTEDL